MKKILSIVLTLAMVTTTLAFSFANASADEQKINRLLAFGDSVVFGDSKIYNPMNGQKCGDQQFANLIASEYGLNYIYNSSDTTTDGRWYRKYAKNGAIMKNEDYMNANNGSILNQVKNCDDSIVAAADTIVMDGGINDVSQAVGISFLNKGYPQGCTNDMYPQGTATDLQKFTLSEMETFVDTLKNMTETDNYHTWQEIKQNIVDGYKEVLDTLIAKGFKGTIYMQNNINPFTEGDKSNQMIYYWDSIINYFITDSINTTIKNYPDVDIKFVDLCSELRNGTTYTGHFNTWDSPDNLHLTFAGNQAVYKYYSKFIDTNANTLDVGEDTLPSGISWKTLINFDEGNLTRAKSGELISLADLNGVIDLSNPTSTTYMLKAAEKAEIDLSGIDYSNIYGIRVKFTNKYAGEFFNVSFGSTNDKQFYYSTRNYKNNGLPALTTSGITANSVIGDKSSQYGSTIGRQSDIEKITSVSLTCGKSDDIVYVDSVEVYTSLSQAEVNDLTGRSEVTTTTTKPVATDGTTLVNAQKAKFIAHRGLHINGATENGVTAFENAGKRNYWGIETDVHVTSDGKFVICHDDTTGRTASTNLTIEQSTYEDLRKVKLNDGTTLPSLEEYLQICKKYNKYAVLEFKNRMAKSYIEDVVKICEQEYSLDKMVFISFSLDNLIDLRSINSTVTIQYLSNSAPSVDTLTQYNFGCDAAYTALNSTNVANYIANKIDVNAWTVDNKSTAEQLISWGANYITTNSLQPDPNPGSTTTTTTTTTTTVKLPDGYYDAYTATLSGGATKNTNHTGYIGSGFVDNFGKVGSSVTFNVNVATAGNYTLDFRYSNSCGDGKDSYPTLYIDDQKIQELTFTENGKSSLPNYTGWNVWSNNTEYVANLSAGSHKIKLQYDRATYSANLDGLTVTAAGGETPTNPTNPSSETSSTSTTTTTTKQATVGEDTILLFNADTFTLSDNTASQKFDFGTNDGIPNIFGKISDGTGVTMTSKVQLAPGVYDLTIYARARAVRPKFDIEVNGTVVGEGVDTSNTVLGTNNDAPVALNSITIPKTTYVTIKITGSTGIAESWLYLNSLKFTKTADVPTESSLATMVEGASIRLGDVNGIRFYTKVDIDKIAQLRKDGATVEMGTLIGPKDLIGDDELTLDLVKDKKCVNVEYKATEYYTEGEFKGIVGSIVNIKESNTSFSTENGNIAREFVGRGYVKVTKDGATTITYADYSGNDIANNSRSLAYVSYKFANDESEPLKNYSELIQEKVKAWASLYQA